MRITRLHLTRFGMFTDVEFSLLPHGVNVVVGANEAGKTTAMAAIQQLLYGIPVRSAQGYIHGLSNLRIGATLQDEAGIDLALVRVKRQTNTLRSSSDAPIDEEELRRLLHGVDGDVYRTLFAIGQEEIASGGQALLKSSGELGRALFGAGTGLTRLNRAMAQLDSRAGELFKPSASRPAINTSLAKFKGLSLKVKELSQSTTAVVKLDDELQQAEKDLTLSVAQFRDLSNRRNLATRVRATRPLVQDRRRFLEELTSLEEQGSRVAHGVPIRLDESQQLRATAQLTVTLATTELNDLQGEISLLHVDESLLEQADLVSTLVEDIGALRQNMKDLPSLNKQVGDLERKLDSLRRTLPAGCLLDSQGLPTISGAILVTIRRLIKERPVLDASLQSNRSLLADVSLKLRRAAEEIAAADPSHEVTQLRTAVARIRQEGRLEVARDETMRKATEIEGSIAATLMSLGVAVEPADADRLKRFSNRPCTTWGGRGTSAHTDAGGPMRAYSMDLRERALLDSDAGMKAADVAAKYRVSGSWVRLLKQRRRETGEVAPRVQRQGRRGMLEPHLHTLAALIAAHPDRTLAELKDALATPASVPTVWRAVRALGLTVKKNGPPVRTRSA